jgi:predicted TIM-barrel fold metal-dependent hydrolase
MDELNRRKAVVYTHPTTPACCRGLMTEVPDHLIEFATDTTRTMASLLLTGTIKRCPDIRFIFSHAGGTMPFLVERITWWARVHPEVLTKVPQGPLAELKKFFYDTAFSANPHALASLFQLVSASQVLFGTDFPFRFGEENVKGLAEYGLSAGDLRLIESENARRLLPQLKAPARV